MDMKRELILQNVGYSGQHFVHNRHISTNALAICVLISIISNKNKLKKY